MTEPSTSHRRRLACYGIALSIACSLRCTLPAAADNAVAADPSAFADAAWNPSSPLAAYALFLNNDSTQQEDAAAPAEGYAWRGIPPTQPDWRGVGRDTAYFLGYQFSVIAVLYIAPESISGWDREQKRNYDFEKWRNNVSEPVWDGDKWWIN